MSDTTTMPINLLAKVRGQVKVKVRSVTQADLRISSCVFYVYRGFWRSSIRTCYSFETPSLYFYDSTSSSELPKSLAAGRPPPMLRGGRDLAVLLGLCSNRDRTKALNYISKCCQLSSKHDGRCFMGIFAIATSVLSCKVKKISISPQIAL